MEEIIKKDKDTYKKFQESLTADLNKRKFIEGELISGTVESIGHKFIFLDLGLKSSGTIPVSEFKLTQSLNSLTVGAKVDVLLEKLENRDGEVVISFAKAKRRKSWSRMERCYESGETVTGTIISKCRGGMVVEADSCLMFLPGSQISLRPLKDYSSLMKIPLEFAIVKMDKLRGNIVCSRRKVLEKIRDHDRDKIVSQMKEGQIVENAIVKNITSFGAFIDLQGIDSLLHINEISYSRIERPSDVQSIGETIRVKIIKIDEQKKISVSVKALSEDIFLKEIDKFEIGKQYPATISKIMDYGAFATLADGIVGLIHNSEISHVKKNIHPQKVFSPTQKVQVEVLEKNIELRRVSLSYKSCIPNDWVEFKKNYSVGSTCMGTIVSSTDYGIFSKIDGTELTGMCHYKNLSWSEKESELGKYKRNQKVKFIILEISEKNEKLRLGLRELKPDPFDFFKNKKVGDVVTVIVESSSKNGIYVYAGNKDMTIFIKKNQLASEIENARPSRFIPGQKVDSLITDFQKNERKISLSIKDLEIQEEKKIIKKFGSKGSGMQLADLLGPLLKKNKEKSKK